MRLPQRITFFLLLLLCSCDLFTGDKETPRLEPKKEEQLKDSEYRKLRKQQDSLLDQLQKKSKKKDLDTLRPVQA